MSMQAKEWDWEGGGGNALKWISPNSENISNMHTTEYELHLPYTFYSSAFTVECTQNKSNKQALTMMEKIK